MARTCCCAQVTTSFHRRFIPLLAARLARQALASKCPVISQPASTSMPHWMHLRGARGNLTRAVSCRSPPELAYSWARGSAEGCVVLWAPLLLAKVWIILDVVVAPVL